MPDKRLVAIVTGLMLIVGGLSAGAQEPSLDQLRTIDALLSRNDSEGLLAFLLANPALLSGEDELAAELRKFVADASGGRLKVDYVSSSTPAAPVVPAVPTRGATDLPGIY